MVIPYVNGEFFNMFKRVASGGGATLVPVVTAFTPEAGDDSYRTSSTLGGDT